MRNGSVRAEKSQPGNATGEYANKERVEEKPLHKHTNTCIEHLATIQRCRNDGMRSDHRDIVRSKHALRALGLTDLKIAGFAPRALEPGIHKLKREVSDILDARPTS